MGICKLVIKAYSDSAYGSEKGEFVSTINPSNLKISSNIKYNNSQLMWNTNWQLMYNMSNPQVLSFSLIFDNTGIFPCSDIDVKTQISSLEGLLHSCQNDTKEPLYVRVIWGSVDFKGRLTKMDVSYTMFKNDGSPIKAQADISIIEHKGQNVGINSQKEVKQDKKKEEKAGSDNSSNGKKNNTQAENKLADENKQVDEGRSEVAKEDKQGEENKETKEDKQGEENKETKEDKQNEENKETSEDKQGEENKETNEDKQNEENKETNEDKQNEENKETNEDKQNEENPNNVKDETEKEDEVGETENAGKEDKQDNNEQKDDHSENNKNSSDNQISTKSVPIKADSSLPGILKNNLLDSSLLSKIGKFNILDSLRNLVAGAALLIPLAIAALLGSLLSKLLALIKRGVTYVKNKAKSASKAVKSGVNKVKDGAKNVANKAKDGANNVKDGGKNLWNKAKDGAKSGANKVKNKIKK